MAMTAGVLSALIGAQFFIRRLTSNSAMVTEIVLAGLKKRSFPVLHLFFSSGR
jgi:hypothetical protein